MKRMENLKSIQWMTRFIIVMIVLVLIAIFTGCSKSISPSKRYAKEHADRSFESAMSRTESFTMRSVKEDLKSVKEKNKRTQKKERATKKRDAVLSRIEKIKNN